MTQTEMAALGGVTRFAQGKFESGENLPGGAYLLGVHAAGFDVAYILTGVAGALDAVESELLVRFRAASNDVQGAVLRAIGIPAAGNKRAAVSITGGEQGQVIAGDVQQRGVTITVGGKKRGAEK